jgi:hypothetical protein
MTTSGATFEAEFGATFEAESGVGPGLELEFVTLMTFIIKRMGVRQPVHRHTIVIAGRAGNVKLDLTVSFWSLFASTSERNLHLMSEVMLREHTCKEERIG